MIQVILARLGLRTIAPFVLLSIITTVLGSGGVAAWWFDWFKWFNIVDTTLLVLAVVFVYLYATTNSQLVRLVIVAGLMGLGYVKGKHDENALTDAKVQAEVTAVHSKYKQESDEEADRQGKVNAEAAEKATVEKQVILKQLLDSRGELQKLRQEVDRDKNAEHPALGIDSVERLNRVRSKQRGRGAGTRGPKA